MGDAQKLKKAENDVNEQLTLLKNPLNGDMAKIYVKTLTPLLFWRDF